MAVLDITVENLSTVLGDGVVVIDFYAPWCGPCKRAAPAFEKMAAAYPTVKFAKCDIDSEDDELPAFSRQFGVESVPTFIVFRNAKPVAAVEGADLERVEALVAKYSK